MGENLPFIYSENMVSLILASIIIITSFFSIKKRSKLDNPIFRWWDLLRLGACSLIFCMPFLLMMSGRSCLLSAISLLLMIAFQAFYLYYERKKTVWVMEIFCFFFGVLLIAAVYGVVYLSRTV